MNRRAKLSLAAANGNGHKREPSGFEDPTMAPEADANTTRKQRAKPHRAGHASEEALVERRGWPSAGQVAKVLLVVTVSALGIYLLKRRFF